MYPSHDLNPIAIEHWQRERLAKDVAFVDAAAARDDSARVHGLLQSLRQFFYVARLARSGAKSPEPTPSVAPLG